MDKRASARSEKENGRRVVEFELRSYPLRLDCPFRLTTPMAGGCDSSTKTETEYLCILLYGGDLSPYLRI